MSGRTWIMMLIMLALNWGGFLFMLIYGIRQEGRKMRSNEGRE
jgi:arginine exporter protein ArgO